MRLNSTGHDTRAADQPSLALSRPADSWQTPSSMMAQATTMGPEKERLASSAE